MTNSTEARTKIEGRMILRATLTSPFGRKVRMAAKILNLDHLIDIVPANTLDDRDTLREHNPLGKMPTLLLNDGTAIFDSRVILEFLDSLLPKPRLIPASDLKRYIALTRATLADGIAEAGLLMIYESRFRETPQISDRWLSHQRGKVFRAMDFFEAALPDLARTDMVSISLACALGYLDWREPVQWRGRYPGLVNWLADFSAREPAFDATKRPE